MGKTIISVSGYGATGSSAIVDLLKEYSCIEVLDEFEFQLHYFPDAISDLDYKLNESCSRFYDSDLAITRFLNLCSKLDEWYKPAFNGHLLEMAQEYINQLEPVTWEGYWAYDRLMTSQEHKTYIDEENYNIQKRNRRKHLINRILRKLQLPLFNDALPLKSYYKERKMYMSLKPSCFLEKTQAFTDRLIQSATHTNANIIAINQLLPPQNPTRFEKYFSCPIKSIVVRRDPRDLWMHYHILKKSFHSPRKNVEEFIRWYKENLKECVNVKSDNILRISFEDIIYNFNNTTEKICSFIGISNDKISMSHFNPNKSAVNTRLFEKYSGCEAEISKITNNLSEYLYDFNSQNKVTELSGIKVF